MILSKMMLMVLLSHISQLDIQQQRVKNTIYELKLVTFGSSTEKPNIEDIQYIVARLTNEVEKLERMYRNITDGN